MPFDKNITIFRQINDEYTPYYILNVHIEISEGENDEHATDYARIFIPVNEIMEPEVLAVGSILVLGVVTDEFSGDIMGLKEFYSDVFTITNIKKRNYGSICMQHYEIEAQI